MFNTAVAETLRTASKYARYQFELSIHLTHLAEAETFYARGMTTAAENSERLADWWENEINKSEQNLSCTEMHWLTEEVNLDWKAKNNVDSFTAVYRWRIQESTRNMAHFNALA